MHHVRTARAHGCDRHACGPDQETYVASCCGTPQQAAASGELRTELDEWWGVDERVYHLSSLSWAPYLPEFGFCKRAVGDALVEANPDASEIALEVFASPKARNI